MTMLSSSSVVIAVTSAAAVGYSIYFLVRQLSPSIGRFRSRELSNASPERENNSTFTGPIFFKPADANEEAIYKTLESHPCIVKFLGTDPPTRQIMLAYLRNGNLLFHLQSNSDIPLATRLTWAIEIAQGVAHLHARDVIWADPRLQNVLLTDDYHAVLCDFGLSVYKAPYSYKFSKGPPPIYSCPIGYNARTPRRRDIFGLGVILFVLLSGRFPFHTDLFPSPPEEIAVMDKHDASSYDVISGKCGDFDRLPPLLHSYFGSIVTKCFAIEYQSADVLVTELEAACSLWWENEQLLMGTDSVNVDTPYPHRPVHCSIEPVQRKYVRTRPS
ncbi:kinase-like domain-containing protein [Gymnopilus junonius]|uniref:Kinase-like domain-containing protein n=1 Tax=Gymnopilus junonius TaxID=109634 RepID=A0A9P5NBB9_GYMJU|nr:kinase-like domain-containing protein [Gymnopilus junonius]